MKKIILFQIAALLFAVVARAAIPDNFANAQVLSGSLVSATNSNQTATTENGEPTATGNQTLWYVWTAPATGEATINLNGSGGFTQVLTVWLGSSLANLNLVVSGYPVTFPVVQGTVYHICTGSYYTGNGNSGIIQVNLSLGTSSSISGLNMLATATTANDNFVNRIVTSTSYGSYVAYNPSATREPTETTPGYNTVWWDYHAPASGLLDINDLGDGTWTFTKLISVYSGTSVNNLSLLTQSVTAGDCYLPVVQGNDYQICISSYYSGNGNNGPIVMTFSLQTSYLSSYNINGGSVSTNDNFNSAAILPGVSPAAVSYNTYATREALEPGSDGNNTIWFKWTAQAAGQTTAYIPLGDSFYKDLTIYTGTSINALTQVAQILGYSYPTLNFTAVSGQTYYFAVGSYYTGSGNNGSIVFSILGQPGSGTAGPTITMAPAYKLSFATDLSRTYRVQQSADLNTWNSLTNVLSGNGLVQGVYVDKQASGLQYFRVSAQ